MTNLVQVALAEDVSEAEELCSMLRTAGIEPSLETAVDHHPRATENAPQKVLVQESAFDAAMQAIEALSEPDELVSDA